MVACTGPSMVRTLPDASDVCLEALQGVHSPQCFRFGLDAPTSPWERQAAGWRGHWSCCCRRIPQTAPKGLFLFEKSLVLSSATPYKEGPVLSHSPPLQVDQGLSRSEPNTAQLSTLPSLCPQSPWVYRFALIPLPATSQCCSSLVWQGREPLAQLSPRSLAWGCSHPGPCAGPRDLFVLKQSLYHLFFQCPLYFLVSYS